MTIYSTQRDLTAVQRSAQPTQPHLLLYLCGTAGDPHKGLRLGGEFRGTVPMRCPKCVHGRRV